jgi:hydrogenase nickel incorporation protein HypA/HybF
VHELALCASIAGIVERHAADREVVLVRVRAGVLRQVVPDTLAYCWTLVTDGTALGSAQLAIDVVPARLRCGGCAAETELGSDLLLRCGACGSTDVRVVTGDEFVVASIDVRQPEAAR